MARKKQNYTQYLFLAAIAVFIIVGIANYGASTSGHYIEYSPGSKSSVNIWTCTEFNNNYYWEGTARSGMIWNEQGELRKQDAECIGHFSCGSSSYCGSSSVGEICICR